MVGSYSSSSYINILEMIYNHSTLLEKLKKSSPHPIIPAPDNSSVIKNLDNVI